MMLSCIKKIWLTDVAMEYMAEILQFVCCVILFSTVSSRIRDLKQNLTSLLSQIDLAYSIEIMQIPPVSYTLLDLVFIGFPVLFCTY